MTRKKTPKKKEEEKEKVTRAGTMETTVKEANEFLAKDEKKETPKKEAGKRKSPAKEKAGKEEPSPKRAKRAGTMETTVAEGKELLEKADKKEEAKSPKKDTPAKETPKKEGKKKAARKEKAAKKAKVEKDDEPSKLKRQGMYMANISSPQLF